MTRVQVFQEDTEVNGYFFQHGSLKTVQEPIPVTFQFRHENIIGLARGMQRDSLGNITFEVELQDPALAASFEEHPSLYDWHFACSDMSYVTGLELNDCKIITTGVIRQLGMMPIPGFPMSLAVKSDVIKENNGALPAPEESDR
jgi:hypothetical protein